MTDIDNHDDAEAAAAWAIRLDARDLDPGERLALDAWLEEAPARAGALLRAEAALAYLDRGRALHDATPVAAAPARRRFLGWAAGGGAALAASLASGFLLLPPRGERFSTATGEVRRLPLPDGSVATLNTRSTLRVAIRPDRRDIALVDGEAWFQVAHDRARPFLVEAGDVRVRAVGTAFSVRRHDDGTDILVTEGVVEAWRDGSGIVPVRIRAGESSFVPAASKGAAAPIRQAEAGAAIDRALAWRSGELSLDGDELSAAIGEINRYNDLQLEVDPALGRERLTGLFRTNDPARFAEAAAATVGGRMVRTDHGLKIEVRPPL